MLGTSSKTTPDFFSVRVFLPTRIGPDLAEIAFCRPLSQRMKNADLGYVDAFTVTRDEDGEPESLILTLKTRSRSPRVLDEIADILEALDAPVGSTAGFDGSGDVISFGVSHGLGLYIPAMEADDETRLDILELCTDAMEGAGLYQGTARVGDRTALYFYGESFNRMRKAITFAMTTDPRCERVIVRRLT